LPPLLRNHAAALRRAQNSRLLSGGRRRSECACGVFGGPISRRTSSYRAWRSRTWSTRIARRRNARQRSASPLPDQRDDAVSTRGCPAPALDAVAVAQERATGWQAICAARLADGRSIDRIYDNASRGALSLAAEWDSRRSCAPGEDRRPSWAVAKVIGEKGYHPSVSAALTG